MSVTPVNDYPIQKIKRAELRFKENLSLKKLKTVSEDEFKSVLSKKSYLKDHLSSKSVGQAQDDYKHPINKLLEK